MYPTYFLAQVIAATDAPGRQTVYLHTSYNDSQFGAGVTGAARRVRSICIVAGRQLARQPLSHLSGFMRKKYGRHEVRTRLEDTRLAEEETMRRTRTGYRTYSP